MEYNNILYEKFKRIDHSQYGEDGMIEEVFRRLNISSGVVVDVGASDGQWFSNTFNLLKRGFTVYGIERSDTAKKMFELKEKYPNIIPYQVGVERDKESPNHINKILDGMDVPQEVDLMSIDIDSIDVWIFEDCNRDVKLYVIEIEPRNYPSKMIYHDPKGNRETNPPQNLTGFGPMYEVAKKKGYTLIGMSINNLFFLKDELLDELNWPEVTKVNELSNFNPRYLDKEDTIKWKEANGI